MYGWDWRSYLYSYFIVRFTSRCVVVVVTIFVSGKEVKLGFLLVFFLFGFVVIGSFDFEYDFSDNKPRESYVFLEDLLWAILITIATLFGFFGRDTWADFFDELATESCLLEVQWIERGFVAQVAENEPGRSTELASLRVVLLLGGFLMKCFFIGWERSKELEFELAFQVEQQVHNTLLHNVGAHFLLSLDFDQFGKVARVDFKLVGRAEETLNVIDFLIPLLVHFDCLIQFFF